MSRCKEHTCVNWDCNGTRHWNMKGERWTTQSKTGLLGLAYAALRETGLQFGMDEAYPPTAIEAFEKLGDYLYPDKAGSKSKASGEANTAGSPDSQK